MQLLLGNLATLCGLPFLVSLSGLPFVVSPSEVKTEVIRTAQMNVYLSEMTRLSQGREVLRSSHLHKYRPALNADGLLVVKGRFPDSETSKHLIVLPKDHSVTKLIVADVHTRQMRHVGGRLWTVNEVKKTYWSPGLRNLVYFILRECYLCGVFDAQL